MNNENNNFDPMTGQPLNGNVNYNPMPNGQTPNGKNGNNVVLLIVVAIVAAVVAGLVTYFILGNKNDESSTKKDNNNTNEVNTGDKDNNVEEPSTSGKIVCTLNNDSIASYQLSAKYIIYYTDKYVDSVSTIEEVTSDDDIVLTTFKTTLEQTYGEMAKKYGGYNIDVKINGNKLTSTVTIDYKVMDIKKFAEDETSLQAYMKDGKLLASGLQTIYEAINATCE